MLFGQQIEEDPETIYPPAGVNMVGCGAGVTYSGNNLMAGSYNNTESGKVENGWKHVWDFSTSQANGTIACAALTTQAGGKVTAGSYPYADDYKYGSGTSLKGNDEYLNRTGTYIVPNYTEINTGGDYGQYGILYIDGKNERILRVHDAQSICTNYFQWTTDSTYEYRKRSVYYKKSIAIDIYKMAFQSVSLFDVNNGKSYEDGLINTVTVEMPQQLKNLISEEALNRANYYWIPFEGCSDGYIYLALRIPGSAGNNPLAHGEEFYIWQISVEDFSSEYFVLTNSTGENIAWNVSNALNNRAVLVTADFVFSVSISRKVYSISRQDGSAKELKFPDGISMNMYSLDKAVFFKGKLYIFETSYTYIYDPITAEMRIKNYAPAYSPNNR